MYFSNADVFGLVFFTIILIVGFMFFVAGLVYFHRKNNIVLRALESNADPLLIRRLFRDGHDEALLPHLLLSNLSVQPTEKGVGS